MRYKYTKEDIDFLKKYYPIGQWDMIDKRFPNLTHTCIYKKCYRLGIKSLNTHRKNFDISKTRTKCTDEETQILIDNYAKISISDLEKLLPNRNVNMIKSKASQLKLVSYQADRLLWKEEEIKYLIDNWELTPDKIMAQHLGKSFRAVKWKREELGLYRRDFENYTYSSLSKYLRGQISKWKKDSMIACNYQCVLTGSKDFEIHHLYGFSNILKELLTEYPQYQDKSFSDYSEDDLSFILEKFLDKHNKYPLGVCVDKKLHVLFHSMYGQYYNTAEQWDRFCEDYKSGKYNMYV